MARGGTRTAPEADSATENGTTPTVEADAATPGQGDGSQPDTTESGEQGTATTVAAKPSDDDLTAWRSALDAGLAAADTDTGTTDSASKSAVATAYKALSVKGRNAAKKAVQDMLRTFVRETKVEQAQALIELNDAMTEGAAAKQTKTPAAPVDPTEAFVNGALRYRLAYRVFTTDVPTEVDAAWQDKVNERLRELEPQLAEYRDYLKKRGTEGNEELAEPEGIDDVVKTAFKLASGKGAAGRAKSSVPRAAFDGPRRDLAKHIQEAFAEHPSGKFLKISEIRSFKSSEYGDDIPSSGAISARLFPKSGKATVDGVTPAEQDGHKGATKN